MAAAMVAVPNRRHGGNADARGDRRRREPGSPSLREDLTTAGTPLRQQNTENTRHCVAKDRQQHHSTKPAR